MQLLSSITDNIYLEGAGTAVLIVLLGSMVLVAVGVNVLPRLIHRWEIRYTTRDITYGAVCLAMSYALSWATLFRLPQGGSVTPAALAPLFIYCYYFGFRKGMVVSTAYALLQLTQGAYIVSPWSAFFDYLLPCFSICVVGLLCYRPQRYAEFLKKRRAREGGKLAGRAYTVAGHWGLFAGVVVHAVIRYLSSAFSGILFFGEWAPAEYGAVVWGFLYNAVLLADSAVALAVCILLAASRTFNMYMTASFDDKKRLAAERGDPEVKTGANDAN